MDLTLDVPPLPPPPLATRAKAGSQINTDLLPITPSSTFSFALASSLLPDGEKEGEGGWRAGIEGGLADDWEYVMYGKVGLSSLRVGRLHSGRCEGRDGGRSEG